MDPHFKLCSSCCLRSYDDPTIISASEEAYRGNATNASSQPLPLLNPRRVAVARKHSSIKRKRSRIRRGLLLASFSMVVVLSVATLSPFKCEAFNSAALRRRRAVSASYSSRSVQLHASSASRREGNNNSRPRFKASRKTTFGSTRRSSRRKPTEEGGSSAVQTKKKSKKNASNSMMGQQQAERSWFNYNLLSKSEEQALARNMQRARRLESELEALLQLQQQNKQQQSFNGRQQETAFLDEPQKREMKELLMRVEEYSDAYEEDDEDYVVAGLSVYSSVGQDAEDMDPILGGKSHLLEDHDRKSLLLGSENVDTIMSTSDMVEDVPVKQRSQRQSQQIGGGSSDSVVVDDAMAQQLGLKNASEFDLILYEGAYARDVLIRRNLKLVFSICNQWVRNHGATTVHAIYSGSWSRPSLSEAMQEGCVGLIQAVERFDPSRNLKFSTYATYYITNHVRRCFQETSTGVLRVPTGYHDTRAKFRRLVKEYHEIVGGTPSLQQMARDLNLKEKRLRYILRMTKPLQSTDNPLSTMQGESKTVRLLDTIVDENEINPADSVELSLLRQSLEDAMATELVPFERDVLRLRLGLDDGVQRTAKEVAAACGGRVSLYEVRTTERRALKKLRSPVALATYQLMTYFEVAGVDRETIKLP